MGGGKKSKSKKKSKPKTKAQKMAVANKKKYGGTASAAKANKAAGKAKAKAKHTASQAAKKTSPSKGGSISKGTTGIGPVKSGATYSKAVSKATNAPTKKTSGVGPVASGKQYASMLKASPPKLKDGTKVASIGQQGPASNIKYYKDANEGKGGFMLDTGAGRPGQVRLKTPLAAAGDVTGLGIGDTKATGFTPTMPGLAKSLGIDSKTGLDSEAKGPSYLSTKSPTTYGAPSQEAVDKAAGITAGGLNIGGGGFTPSKPSGSTSRAISDRPASSFNFGPTVDRFGRGDEYARNINEFGMRFGATPEARADAYERSLTGRKNLFDGATVGSGPVASPDAYARGLEVSRFGSPMNIGKTILNAIPGVNFRLQNDKELADSVGRAPTLKRRGGGGGARLPVAPLTPEEILLPEETAAQTGVDYQQAQTGLDPNRLMQIQQEAYLQAFNPLYNPMFRFFNRRGVGRGAFRKAFRRKD